MFILGLALAMGGYALAYYAVDVMAWSRSPIANQTRPAPLKYILGVPLPTGTVDNTPFHPVFTINDTDRANAVYAMGGAGSSQTGTATPTADLANTPGLGVLGNGAGGLLGG